jgi:hypothetical protein
LKAGCHAAAYTAAAAAAAAWPHACSRDSSSRNGVVPVSCAAAPAS